MKANVPSSGTDVGAAFRHQGYVIVPGALTSAEVEVLREELVALCHDHRAELGLPSTEEVQSGWDLLEHILCIHHPHKLSATMRRFAAHASIVSVLQSIVGPAVKCLQSQYFVKPPGFPGNPWHQDERHVPTRDRSLVAAWLALDDANVLNGCLRVVPGSHRRGYLYPERNHGRADEFDFAMECYGFDEDQQLALEVASGDVVYFNGYLVHGSGKNRGAGYRRALTYHYMNAYSLLPWKIRVGAAETEVRGGDADYRDVFMVAGDDPYFWKGYEEWSFPHLRQCDHPESISLPSVPGDRSGDLHRPLPPGIAVQVAQALRRWPGDQWEALAILKEALAKAEESGILPRDHSR